MCLDKLDRTVGDRYSCEQYPVRPEVWGGDSPPLVASGFRTATEPQMLA